MSQQRVIQTFFIVLTLLVSLTTECSAHEHDHDESKENKSGSGAIKLTESGKTAIGIQCERVETKTVPKRIQTTGKLEAIPTLEYIQHSPIAGRVAEVFVRLGDHVSQGQSLVTVNSPELQKLGAEIVTQKTQIEAEISTQKAELDGEVSQTRTQQELTQVNFDRESKLFAERIASQKALQQAKAELELASNRLKVAEKKREVTMAALKTKLNVNLQTLKQRLKQLGLSDGDVEQMLAKKVSITTVPVRTARAGVITELAATPGQSIDPSDALAKVSQLSKFWATANIYESDMSRVKIGERISVKVAAIPNDAFTGAVSFISSSVDPVSRVLLVKVEVINKGNKLRPGMFADLAVETAEPSYAITLPKDAVLLNKGHYLVYVENDGEYQPTPVEVGNTYGDKIEIRSGLTVGQSVVTRGAFQLDAQRLKSIGDTELFAHPTEEEHEEHEHEEGAGTTNNMLNPQFAIIVAIAFVLGCAITALWLRKGTRKLADEQTPREAELREKGG